MGSTAKSPIPPTALACAAVRGNDKLAWYAEHDPESVRKELDRLLKALGTSWQLEKSYSHVEARLCRLLADAQAYVHEGGEARRVYALHAEQDLAKLKPSVLAVHRALFSRAIEDGLPVLASLRELSVLVSAQSGITVPFKGISLSLRRLEDAGLIEYDSGKSGLRGHSGLISLPLLRGTAPEPAPEAVSYLATTAAMSLGVEESRREARADQDARSDAMRSAGWTPKPRTKPKGMSGPTRTTPQSASPSSSRSTPEPPEPPMSGQELEWHRQYVADQLAPIIDEIGLGRSSEDG